MTLEQVGQEFGVTRERIRQMEIKTLRRLQAFRMARALEGVAARTRLEAPGVGLEPTTLRLTAECSAD